MQSRALNSSTVGDEHETQLRQLLGRHADASIGHAELEPVASVDDLSHPQCDLPLLGELAGIAQQIEQDLPQPHWDRRSTGRVWSAPPRSTEKSWPHFRPSAVDFCGSRLAIGAATERARALAMPAGTRAQALQTRL